MPFVWVRIVGNKYDGITRSLMIILLLVYRICMLAFAIDRGPWPMPAIRVRISTHSYRKKGQKTINLLIALKFISGIWNGIYLQSECLCITFLTFSQIVFNKSFHRWRRAHSHIQVQTFVFLFSCFFLAKKRKKRVKLIHIRWVCLFVVFCIRTSHAARWHVYIVCSA